jgi:hypothetical protein
VIRLRRGTVVRASEARPGVLELEVDVEGSRAAALAYPALTGPLSEGQSVLLNTTAVAEDLGTGGYHFVVAVEGQSDLDPPPEGHLMKLGRIIVHLAVLPPVAEVRRVVVEHREAVADEDTEPTRRVAVVLVNLW